MRSDRVHSFRKAGGGGEPPPYGVNHDSAPVQTHLPPPGTCKSALRSIQPHQAPNPVVVIKQPPPTCHPERAAKDLAQKGSDTEPRCMRSSGFASGRQSGAFCLSWCKTHADCQARSTAYMGQRSRYLRKSQLRILWVSRQATGSFPSASRRMELIRIAPWPCAMENRGVPPSLS